NVPVQRRRAAACSAPHVHNEMAHLRRACDYLSPSAATGCSATSTSLRSLANCSALELKESGSAQKSESNTVSRWDTDWSRDLRRTARRRSVSGGGSLNAKRTC